MVAIETLASNAMRVEFVMPYSPVFTTRRRLSLTHFNPSTPDAQPTRRHTSSELPIWPHSREQKLLSL